MLGKSTTNRHAGPWSALWETPLTATPNSIAGRKDKSKHPQTAATHHRQSKGTPTATSITSYCGVKPVPGYAGNPKALIYQQRVTMLGANPAQTDIFERADTSSVIHEIEKSTLSCINP